MPNITVSVPDDHLHDDEGTCAFARGKRLQEETVQKIGIFHGADRLSRDEVHDRDALR
jgi:hypothetical protein